MQVIENAFSHLTAAYYQNNVPRIPTDKELKAVQQDITAMNATGKIIVAGSALGLGVTCVVWQVPYIGKPFGLISGIASLVLGAIGHDVIVASNNMHEFAGKRITNVGSNLLKSEKDFNLHLIDTATKGTWIARTLYDLSPPK